jgi:hypothetical protein
MQTVFGKSTLLSNPLYENQHQPLQLQLKTEAWELLFIILIFNILFIIGPREEGCGSWI